MVTGAKAVGETAASIGEGVVNAGKAAGETVGKLKIGNGSRRSWSGMIRSIGISLPGMIS